MDIKPPEPSPGTPEPSPGTPEPSPGTPEPSPGTPEPSPGTPEPSPGTPIWRLSECPVTRLPVRSRPEWQRIALTGEYSVSFSIIGDAVLHTEPVGNAGSIGIPRLYEKRAEVLRQAGLAGRPYCEIMNYSGIPLRHPGSGRQQLMEALTGEYDTGTLQGFWGYGGPWVIRWILNTAKLVAGRPDVQVYYVNDYATAIRETQALLGSLVPASRASVDDTLEARGWSYAAEGFSVTFDVLDDGVVLERTKGRFRLHHVKPYFAMLEQFLDVTNPRGDGSFVQINDGGDLEHIDWRAAVHYFRAAAELHRRHHCHGIVVCNALGPVSAVSRVGHRIFPFPFVVEPDLPRARSRALELCRSSPPAAAPKGPDVSLVSPSVVERVNEVVRYAATINWHARGIDEPAVADDDPFAPIYQLLRVLKLDFDTILADREAMQEQVLRASKLSALGTLTAGVSHELNSPLTAVLGDASVILECSEDPEIIRSAQRIQRCARRMRDIIDQLSVFGRSSTEGVTEDVDVDVNECVIEAHEELGALLRQRSIEATLYLAPSLPSVRCDPGHLKTVIHNVLINASTAYKGIERPRPFPVTLATACTDDWVQIVCVDEGAGMSADVRARAFDPFFTTRDVGEGLGLGLYICDRLITNHGGRIHLESEKGAGTKVIIELPRAPLRRGSVGASRGPGAARPEPSGSDPA